MDADEFDKRFGYHPPSAGGIVEAHEAVRAAARTFAEIVNANTVPGREQSLAFTAIEEAMMWGNAAIARAQGETSRMLARG